MIKNVLMVLFIMIILSSCSNNQELVSESNIGSDSTADEIKPIEEDESNNFEKSLFDILSEYSSSKSYNTDSSLIKTYADILDSEIGFWDEFHNDPIFLKNIAYEGYDLKVISYTLLDMNDDSVPELLINTTLGSADFVYVFHDVGYEVQSYWFSNRQMGSPKIDGSFTASSGAGDWGIYRITFGDRQYSLDSVGFMESSVDEEGDHIQLFNIGDMPVEEDEYMDFLDNYMSITEPEWFGY